MMRSKVHLALQAVVCIALLILLSISAVEIYREDSAHKAADPMENIYTLEKVTGKFAPIAPLFCASLELMVATDRKMNQRKEASYETEGNGPLSYHWRGCCRHRLLRHAMGTHITLAKCHLCRRLKHPQRNYCPCHRFHTSI